MGRFRGRATLQIDELRTSVEVDLWSRIDPWSGLAEWQGTFLSTDKDGLVALVDAHHSIGAPTLRIHLADDPDARRVVITSSNGWHGNLLGVGDPPTCLRPR